MSDELNKFIEESVALIKRSNDNLNKILLKSSIVNSPFINRTKFAIINDEPLICEEVDNMLIYTMGNCIMGMDKKGDSKFIPYSILIFVSSEEETIDIKKSIILINNTKNNDKLIETFIKKYRVHPNDIHSFGKIDVVSNDYLKKMIPHKIINATSETNVNRKEEIYIYKCYCTNTSLLQQEEQRKNNVIKHTSVVSSWNCLMEKLNNPEYAIIIKKYK